MLSTNNIYFVFRNLLLRNDQPNWGLVVLLTSKMAGFNSKFSDAECDERADILHTQRVLAEVVEMIKTSHLFHRAVMEIEPSHPDYSDLNYGNKLALLSGDYLLSTSFHEVARLKNSQVQEIMSLTLRDLTEGSFLPALPAKPINSQKSVLLAEDETNVTPFRITNVLGHMKSEWILRNVLSGGSLLGRTCQCSLIFANHTSDFQALAYNLGRNIALAWQASVEANMNHFHLLSAPLMFHLEFDPGFYKEIVQQNVDLDYIKDIVTRGPGVEKTIELQKELVQQTFDVLNKFEDNEAKDVLLNIIRSL